MGSIFFFLSFFGCDISSFLCFDTMGDIEFFVSPQYLLVFLPTLQLNNHRLENNLF